MPAIAFLCFIMVMSSCATSRKMGCPMQFSRLAPGQPAPTNLYAYTTAVNEK